jgi:putative transposase
MERFLEFAEAWGARYPAIVRLWENAWAEFVPFLAFDAEIRRLVCSISAIESSTPESAARWRPLDISPTNRSLCAVTPDRFTGPDLRASTQRMMIERWPRHVQATLMSKNTKSLVAADEVTVLT